MIWISTLVLMLYFLCKSLLFCYMHSDPLVQALFWLFLIANITPATSHASNASLLEKWQSVSLCWVFRPVQLTNRHCCTTPLEFFLSCWVDFVPLTCF